MTAPAATKQNGLPWLLLVLTVGVAVRAALWLGYPPASYNDSGGYRFLAEAALKGWRDYNGTRVPVYPLWMGWIGNDTQVYLSQLLLGLLITLLFFYIGWQASHSPVFGALAGLAHTLNIGQLFFEASLLAETLATFWLALVLACVWLALRPETRHPWLPWLGVGVFGALAGLTRSLYLFVPFWAGFYLAVAPVEPGRRLTLNFRPLVLAALPALLLIGLWVNFIYTRYGILSITTMGGFHLVQHTGQWFELLPDQDALLRDIFLEYRARQISETGSPGNTIWDALPAMEKASGHGFLQLSADMANASFYLIWHYPERYLWSVLDGWQLYWRVPVYWKAAAFASPTARGVLELIITVERILLIGCNLVFLLATALALVWRGWRERLGWSNWWIFIVVTLWLTSLLQSLPDHGDNPRFLVPMQTWVVLWVLWAAWCWLKKKRNQTE